MTPWIKTELAYFTIIGSILTCAHGLNLDFSRLSFYKNPLLNKRSTFADCASNPCPITKPFLCRSESKCIALSAACDGVYDCSDGFDEQGALCNAASRPSLDEMEHFINSEAEWIIPHLFNGASIESVAHALTVASSLTDLRQMLGLTTENADNIFTAFDASLTGDDRPLVEFGMNPHHWNEVRWLFGKLMDSGFQLE